MKNVTKLWAAFSAIIGLCLISFSCVDDYTDANPTPRLDAPTIRVSATGSNQKILAVPVNQYQNDNIAYVTYGGPIDFTISVIDAPGKVATVDVTPSVPEFGTVELNTSSVAALQGQEQGQFTFTFTPNPALPDQSDRVLNLVVTVADSQVDDEGESNPKVTTLTVPTTIVTCLSDQLEEGTYKVTAASGNVDGGIPYTLDDLVADSGGDVFVEITAEFPGRYSMDEVTGGVWPTYYAGRARPAFEVDLCGNVIQGHSGAVTAGASPGPLRTFDVDGTLNGDGTVTITWSYVRDDAPTPANPAKGTFTLTKQ
jgi:hypothetical protein